MVNKDEYIIADNQNLTSRETRLRLDYNNQSHVRLTALKFW